MQKLDGIREKISGLSARAISTIETGVGAWVGGLIEGRTRTGRNPFPAPLNLFMGSALVLMDHVGMGGERYREHYGNFGNGLLGSYLAGIGYRFGHRMWEISTTKIAEQRLRQMPQGAPS